MAALSSSSMTLTRIDSRCAVFPGWWGCPPTINSFALLRTRTPRQLHGPARSLSSSIQVQRERESLGQHGEVSRRKNWQCFSELQNSESETADTDSISLPNCCNDGTEQGASGGAKEEAVTSGGGGSGQEFVTYGPGKKGNQLVALASVTVAVGLFLAGRVGDSGPGLPQLAANSISYEEALKNSRPTVVEFYADWCEVCNEMAHDIYQVEEEYRDRINFVMLNVDNSKWEQELDEFGVEGIPHFAFLDSQGNEEGNIVGRLPKKILKENLAALAQGDATVPHSRVVGKFSSADSRQAPPAVGPLSHGPDL